MADNHANVYKKPEHHLKVVIIGAGLAGLALAGLLGKSGHNVVVLEAAPQISEVGAGLTCAPNLTRLLSRWGLDGSLRPKTDALHHVSLRRWQGGEVLGASPLMPEVERRYGAPQYVVHRADVHTALMQQAAGYADIQINSTVVAVDFQKPSVTLEDGRVIEADLIVGADGMKSTCRKLMYEQLGQIDKATPTGDAAFRACIPLEKVTDPHLREFVQRPNATRWMGAGRHVQGYPIRHGELYNLVMCHPDPGFAEESWTAKASKENMLSHFGDWDPGFLRKLVDLIPDDNILIWQLCQHEPLPTWVMGKLVLMGDACHPMLPYVAQGAAQAIEDAAVLHLALNSVSSADELPVLLKAYELARKPRAEHIMSVAGDNRVGLHLPDGPEQEARDEKFRLLAQGGDNPDLLGNDKTQLALWGHDPEKEFLENREVLIEQARQLIMSGNTREI
ncbi:hypothetical protein B0A52_01305 [Exophiala mesophila]|uniref:FAD-binding domain-containing protein n=1 Tax=Exophiala mesophila TaxID=212818 RepID=A0A438NH27_EXOME|nr:hypothetical protein B0A52_01305 [Exophiala mesophila]